MTDNKCKICLAEVSVNYCGNCGQKIIKDFSEDNFSLIFNNISDHFEDFLSENFKKVLGESPFGFIPSGNRLLYIMLVTGYIIRATEERFGESKKIQGLDVGGILSDIALTEAEKIKKITDYIDSGNNLISLDGVEEKLLIVKNIVSVFNSTVKHRFLNFFEKATKKDGASIKKDFDIETAWEVACRNAVWGYLYRMVEVSIQINRKNN